MRPTPKNKRSMPGLLEPLLAMFFALPLFAISILNFAGVVVFREHRQPDGRIVLEYDRWATWKVNWLPNLLLYSGGLLLVVGFGCFIRALWARLLSRRD